MTAAANSLAKPFDIGAVDQLIRRQVERAVRERSDRVVGQPGAWRKRAETPIAILFDRLVECLEEISARATAALGRRSRDRVRGLEFDPLCIASKRRYHLVDPRPIFEVELPT